QNFSLASTFSRNTPLYELVYVAFQGTFAAITCCLILGSVVERMKFSAVLLFLCIWFTCSYCPIAHMVWYWPGPDAYTQTAHAAEVERTPAPDEASGGAHLGGMGRGERHRRPHLALGCARLRRR